MPHFRSVMVTTAMSFFITAAFAAEGDSKSMNHLRHAKAEMFEKMASCLKSDRSDANCEQELKENCEKLGGMKNCGFASKDEMAPKGNKMAGKKGPGSGGMGGMKGGMGHDKMGGMMGHDKMGGMGGPGGMGSPGSNPPTQDPMPADKGGSMPPMEPGDM